MKITKLFLVGAMLGATSLFAEETAQEKVLMLQDFEDQAYFSQVSANGYTKSSAMTGQWSVFKPEKIVSISDEQAASGDYSLKYKSVKPNPYFATCIIRQELTGSFDFECYMNREAAARYIIGFVTEKNGVKERKYSVGTFDNNANLAYLDVAANKWKRSGIKVAADEWMQFVISYDDTAKTVSYYVYIDDVKEKIGEVSVGDSLGKLLYVEFRHNVSTPDSVFYIDDVKISQK